MPDEPNRSFLRSPAPVALAAWLIPGAGYLLLGQKARGITVGVTIIVLYLFGLLVGGVRALEVPGYNAHGVKLYMSSPSENHANSRVGAENPQGEWMLTHHPWEELRSKPWSLPQAMVGPIDVACNFWSVAASQPVNPAEPELGLIGSRSHSRVNELGVLYMAVAGMLNLLAIIDAAHRAAHPEEK